jgi:hypothetical protein
VDILPHFSEHNGSAGVLAEGEHLPPGQLSVVQDLLKHLPGQRRLLGSLGPAQSGHHVLREVVGSVLAELGHRLCDLTNVDFSH